MSYLNDVFRQTADEGYFDFARCQRPDGTFYGTAGTCRKGKQVSEKQVDALKKAAKSGNKRAEAALKVVEGKTTPTQDKAKKPTDYEKGGTLNKDAPGPIAKAERDKKIYEDQVKKANEYLKKDPEDEFAGFIKKQAEKSLKPIINSEKVVEGVTKDVPKGTEVGFKSNGFLGTTFTTPGGTVVTTSFGQGDFNFQVNGKYDAGQITDRKEQMAVARQVQRVWNAHRQNLPEGYVVQATAWGEDGRGASRIRAYKRMGFSDPTSGTDANPGTQYGRIGKGGKVSASDRAEQGLGSTLLMFAEGKDKDTALWYIVIFGAPDKKNDFSEQGEGYLDFARCQRADGTIYGSPGRCKQGKEIGAKEDTGGKRQRSNKGMRLTEKIKAMSASDLKKVAKDPRLSDRQRGKLEQLIKAKEGAQKPDAEAKKAAEEAAKTAPRGKRVGRTSLEQVDRQILRGEVKLDAKKLESNPVYQSKTSGSLSTLKTSYNTMKVVIKDPAFDTPANRARLINTRIAIWRAQKAIRESSATAKIDPKTYEKDLKASPKYGKTPGSTKPISKAKSEDLPALEKQMKSLSARLDKKGISTDEAMKISDEMLDVNRRLMIARGDSKPASPNLKKIYEEQGFNAKPELVATANDLNKRKDLLTNMDGTNVVLYRGVTTQEFSDQFKGLGPNGDEHFAGRGIFGNGSYAGAPSFENPGATSQAGKNVAAAYSGERKDLASKVTAFGLRSDANVSTFRGKSYNERSRAYDQWYDRTLKEAEQKTGYKFNDVGEAAAALGVHAYQVPQRDGDYYIVLNRGAVVAAMDSQLSNDQGL